MSRIVGAHRRNPDRCYRQHSQSNFGTETIHWSPLTFLLPATSAGANDASDRELRAPEQHAKGPSRTVSSRKLPATASSVSADRRRCEGRPATVREDRQYAPEVAGNCSLPRN